MHFLYFFIEGVHGYCRRRNSQCTLSRGKIGLLLIPKDKFEVGQSANVGAPPNFRSPSLEVKYDVISSGFPW